MPGGARLWFLLGVIAVAVAHPSLLTTKFTNVFQLKPKRDARLDPPSTTTTQSFLLSRSNVPFWYDDITVVDAAEMGNLEAVRYRIAAGDNATEEKGGDNMLPILSAARSGNLPLLRFLVEGLGIDVNSHNTFFRRTPAMLAVWYSQIATLQYLIEKGANVTTPHEPYGNPTLLHYAVSTRAYSCAKSLIEAGADVNAWNDDGYTPLHIAAAIDDLPTASLLLNKGASTDWKGPKYGITPLTLAAYFCSGSSDMLKLLVEAGADVNTYDVEENTPLHYAVWRGCDIRLVKYLVQSGANTTSTNKDGKIPLDYCDGCDVCDYLLNVENHSATSTTETTSPTDKPEIPVEYRYSTLEAAIEAKSLPGVRVRVAAGDSLTRISGEDSGFKGYAPIHIAVQMGHLPVLKYLVEDAGAEIELRTNHSERTPLHVAAESRNPEVVRYLLDRGANVGAIDSENYTALHLAASEILVEPVKYLIEAGADVNAVTEYNSSPLHFAAANGFIATVSILLENGALVDGVRETRSTPLQWAAFASWFRDVCFCTIRHLIQNGANTTVVDDEVGTLLHYLVLIVSVEEVKYLVEAGVDMNAKNKYGDTSVHSLAAVWYPDERPLFLPTLKYLVENGADLNAKNSRGQKPIDRYRGTSEEAKLLLTPPQGENQTQIFTLTEKLLSVVHDANYFY